MAKSLVLLQASIIADVLQAKPRWSSDAPTVRHSTDDCQGSMERHDPTNFTFHLPSSLKITRLINQATRLR